jgi:hypothetical protein
MKNICKAGILLLPLLVAACFESADEMANKIVVEASAQFKSLENDKNHENRLNVLRSIDSLLTSIVTTYPSSSIAVLFAGDQIVAGLSKQQIASMISYESAVVEQIKRGHIYKDVDSGSYRTYPENNNNFMGIVLPPDSYMTFKNSDVSRTEFVCPANSTSATGCFYKKTYHDFIPLQEYQYDAVLIFNYNPSIKLIETIKIGVPLKFETKLIERKAEQNKQLIGTMEINWTDVILKTDGTFISIIHQKFEFPDEAKYSFEKYHFVDMQTGRLKETRTLNEEGTKTEKTTIWPAFTPTNLQYLGYFMSICSTTFRADNCICKTQAMASQFVGHRRPELQQSIDESLNELIKQEKQKSMIDTLMMLYGIDGFSEVYEYSACGLPARKDNKRLP